TSGTTLGSFTAATTNVNSFLSDSPLPAPIVSSVTPSDTATGVPKDSMVVVFSESMDPVSTAKAFLLQQVSGGSCSQSAPCAVAGTFNWPMPSVLAFKPSTPLVTPFAVYKVT